MQRHITARNAWIGLAGIILAWEYMCPPGQLLSEEADKWVARNPILSRLGFFAVALHLGNLLPNWCDPIHLIACVIGRVKHRDQG